MNRKNAARASSYRSAPVRIVSLRAFGFSFDEGEEDEYTGILEEDTHASEQDEVGRNQVEQRDCGCSRDLIQSQCSVLRVSCSVATLQSIYYNSPG